MLLSEVLLRAAKRRLCLADLSRAVRGGSSTILVEEWKGCREATLAERTAPAGASAAAARETEATGAATGAGAIA